MNKWLYGDSWEKYQIESGQTWIETNTNSKLQVWDILDSLPDFMLEADMVYSDTPWNTGNITSFYTKAEKEKRCEFAQFANTVFSHIAKIKPKVCYLEIGKQNFELYRDKTSELFPVIQVWNIVYYHKNPNILIRGGYDVVKFDFTGKDDEDTPLLTIQQENLSCVADLCMGRGLTAIAAYKSGKRFVGTELNKRRLAVTIDKIAQLGGNWTQK